MFKKTMKFDDLDGNPVEDTFYFNYKKLEIAELLEFGYVSQFRPDDISSRLPLEQQLEILRTPTSESGLSEKENTQKAYDIFRDLLLDAFGEKGDDNVTFKKTWELRNYWESHVAFDELVFEMVGDTKLAATFIENCLPPRFLAEAKAELEKEGRLPKAGVTDLMVEAARRQQDPATRIEPGLEAAREALGESPEVEALAKSVSKDSTVKKIEDLTEVDIMTMDEVTFKKLDPQKLSKEQMMAAFRRKMQS